jgi:hypothetical protein
MPSSLITSRRILTFHLLVIRAPRLHGKPFIFFHRDDHHNAAPGFSISNRFCASGVDLRADMVLMASDPTTLICAISGEMALSGNRRFGMGLPGGGTTAEGQIKRRTLQLGAVVCFQGFGGRSRNVCRLPSMFMKVGKEEF